MLCHHGYCAPLADERLIRQLENQRAREARLAPAVPDVRLSSRSLPPVSPDFPEETPCFPIQQVELQQREKLPHWLPLQKLANRAAGHCLGGKGINTLMGILQSRLIDSGYVTTRVLAPQQNLHSGKLILTILPGTIRQVRFTPQSGHYVSLFNSFPVKPGALLDLRDIEQGLENLQRVPGVQASMDIIPGKQPGESDILLDWKPSGMWRFGLSLDDAGSRSTGRYQGGVTLYVDNPLSLSDTLYLNAGRALQPHGDKGTHNYTGQYAVPFGYWMTSLTASSNDYYQTIAGLNGDYRYRGKSNNLAFQLSRVLHRSGSQKTRLTWDMMTRESDNFIDDTRIDVQHRKTAAWKVGLEHRHYISAATLDAGISYQRGTRWFGSIPATEEYFGEATALSKILQMNAHLELPFALAGQHFRYNVQYMRQMTRTLLTPQEQFSIGSRWTVRGFDGERTLSADNGWTVRNEAGWFTPLPGQQLYLGVDYGEVSGHSSPYLTGNHLAGGAIGLRGLLSGANYDVFAGIPLSKPQGFTTDPVTFGFSLNWQY
ncbi:ShlB/FhaC/HecB family hemolysin secretion/activation protein [Citrobacter portucalensis]|uniref:ShlB/FhaC/HecB family hemolysin secretion/activation protein n=1 Tax=Citrobacter portucalensis TaxID=1639133 RepID=UPI00226B3375|nr:ShlB/FhaC/HecB family hemolysin secretion/activation protein [Citrobacter portucalensis]MCX8980507.1 ShlB/FhaC/HecB family hemolysin secretion/activation protein [Citrobacter portucalensis]